MKLCSKCFILKPLACLRPINQEQKENKMRKLIVIEVIQDDIDRGAEGNTSLCAIARALKRMGFEHPSVSDDIEFHCSESSQSFLAATPARVLKWMGRFDDDKRTVKPFKFQLRTKVERNPHYSL